MTASTTGVVGDTSTEGLIGASLFRTRVLSSERFVGDLADRAAGVEWSDNPSLHASISKTLIFGILNVTPDSFSDGGTFVEPEVAVQHALAMVQAGADIIDIGGESTRPGAQPVGVDEEISRVLPVIKGLRDASRVAISIDTTCRPSCSGSWCVDYQ